MSHFVTYKEVLSSDRYVPVYMLQSSLTTAGVALVSLVAVIGLVALYVYFRSRGYKVRRFFAFLTMMCSAFLVGAVALGFERSLEGPDKDYPKYVQGWNDFGLASTALGCPDFEMSGTDDFICSEPGEWDIFTDKDARRAAVAAAKPLADRLNAEGCYWLQGDLLGQVACPVQTPEGKALNDKTLFELMQPALPAFAQECTPVYGPDAKEQAINLVARKTDGPIYVLIYTKFASGYVCGADKREVSKETFTKQLNTVWKDSRT